MAAADEAYDRLHGADGHTQAVTPRYTSGLTPAEWTRLWHAAGNGVSRLGAAAEEFDRILAAREQAAATRVRDRVLALADEFDSNVDWSNGRSNYGDNAAWESAARQLRAAVEALPRPAPEATPCEHAWDYSNTPGVNICTTCGELRDWPRGTD